MRRGGSLPRVVGLRAATAIVIGTMIGSGIFTVPQVVAADLKAPAAAMLCWIVGGLFTLCGALSIAELATALPRSGGPFIYLLEAYGPLPAFLLGWTGLTVIMGAGLGALAMIFADYLGVFMPLTTRETHDVAALLIVLVGAMNYAGILRAAAVMSWTTAAKLIVLVALGVLAFTVGHGQPGYSAVRDLTGVSASSFGAALIPIMWTYDGWQDLTFIGGEVTRPQRTLPLALALGIGCVIAVYLLVNLAFYHVMSPAEIARSPQVAAAAATHIPALAGRGASVVAGIVLLSTFSALNGTMIAGPRVLYAMADRGLLFAVVGRVSPRFQTPSVAIWVVTGLGCVYVLGSNFAELAKRFVFGGWPFFIITVAAVFVLRRTRPYLPRPYRIWGYPFTPAAFLLASVSVLGYLVATYPRETLLDFAIILCGVPVYYLWQALAGRPLSAARPRVSE